MKVEDAIERYITDKTKILEFFEKRAKNDELYTVSEISELTGVPPLRASRILYDLRHTGQVYSVRTRLSGRAYLHGTPRAVSAFLDKIKKRR